MKEKLLDFPYFKAPLSHTSLFSGDELESQHCDYCNKQNLEYTFYSTDSQKDKGIYGCIECLKQKKYSISQETDIGFIEKGKILLIEYDDFDLNIEKSAEMSEEKAIQYFKEFQENIKHTTKECSIPQGFNKKVLYDIGFTPTIAMFQGGQYLSHCNDFMVYIGRWNPCDFEKNSVDGDGRKLWMKMIIDEDYDYLWDQTMEDIKKYGDEWAQYENSGWSEGAWVYIFKCKHCNDLKCSWDCD